MVISFPQTVGQVPVYYSHKLSGGRSHWQGDYVDASTKPLYPFGFGLSYTGFEFGNLHIDQSEVPIGGQAKISVGVTNIGPRAGEEVVQLYTRDPQASVTRPVKELRGFKRIALESGQTKTVVFTLSTDLFGFYNPEMNYVVEPGVIEVMVGNSSADIHLTGEFTLTGDVMDVSASKTFFSRVSVM